MPNRRSRASIATDKLIRKHGLKRTQPDTLVLRRQRCGRGFRFIDAGGVTIRDKTTIARLKSLAVPPAYVDVRYAADEGAHLQAVGEDAAGRLQYRYHPEWQKVREAVKAQRLADLAKALPLLRKAVAHGLGGDPCARQATAAVVRLVATTALRAGCDSYARERGTRGATTLLKSNVKIDGRTLHLRFRAKGGTTVTYRVTDRRLATAIRCLLAIPGRRLFQYRDGDGAVRPVRASDVNAFLREVSGRRISLKDFRMLVASADVLHALATAKPAGSDRARRRQVRDAIAAAAETLANTPTVCRASYVHDSVIAAFEQGTLAEAAAGRPTAEAKARALARVMVRSH
jgi:DNA topoisomerase I